MFLSKNVNNYISNNKDVCSEIISTTENDDSRDKNFDINDYTGSSNSEDQIDIEDISEPETLTTLTNTNEKSVKSLTVICIFFY